MYFISSFVLFLHIPFFKEIHDGKYKTEGIDDIMQTLLEEEL